jgi:hypothetical protein
MNKPHLEFTRVDLSAGWAPPSGYPAGIQQKILASDLDEGGKTGSRTRLLRFLPGAYTTAPFVHDHWEEVYLISGDLIVGNDALGRGGESFNAPTYACRPPGARHGPFRSNDGCVLFEIHYYDESNCSLLPPSLAGFQVYKKMAALEPHVSRSATVCTGDPEVAKKVGPNNESNHPRNFCYQCKRSLPPDYRNKPWNVDSRDYHPMFDSQRCRDIAIRRHLHPAFDFTNLTNYLDDEGGTRALKQEYDQYAEAEAFRDLADEYRRFENEYDHSPGIAPADVEKGVAALLALSG